MSYSEPERQKKYYDSMNQTERNGYIIVAKSVKISTDQFLAQKISTKTARFTTYPNSRQNCVNAFEIRYFYAQCLFLTSFLFNHPYHTLQFVVDNFSHHATSTSVGSTSAISNVLQAPMLETIAMCF